MRRTTPLLLSHSCSSVCLCITLVLHVETAEDTSAFHHTVPWLFGFLWPKFMNVGSTSRWRQNSILHRETWTGDYVYLVSKNENQILYNHLFVVLLAVSGDDWDVFHVQPGNWSARKTDQGRSLSQMAVHLHRVVRRRGHVMLHSK